MSMKTAISLPDELFKAAEETAAELGISRSRLFALAVKEFISRHRKEHITEQLNRVYEKIGGPADMDIRTAGIEAVRELTKDDSW